MNIDVVLIKYTHTHTHTYIYNLEVYVQIVGPLFLIGLLILLLSCMTFVYILDINSFSDMFSKSFFKCTCLLVILIFTLGDIIILLYLLPFYHSFVTYYYFCYL